MGIKGVRIGGRQKGTLNKATVQRQMEAARAIDEAKGRPAKTLAKDVLDALMVTARGAMSAHQPITPEMVKAAAAQGQTVQERVGDWGAFGDWFDRTAFVAKALAEYQSPKLRAHYVQAEAPIPLAPPVGFVVDLDSKRDPAALVAAHMRMIAKPKAA